MRRRAFWIVGGLWALNTAFLAWLVLLPRSGDPMGISLAATGIKTLLTVLWMVQTIAMTSILLGFEALTALWFLNPWRRSGRSCPCW